MCIILNTHKKDIYTRQLIERLFIYSTIIVFKCIALRSLQTHAMLEVITYTGDLMHEIESENKYSITKIISNNNYLKETCLGL